MDHKVAQRVQAGKRPCRLKETHGTCSRGQLVVLPHRQNAASCLERGAWVIVCGCLYEVTNFASFVQTYMMESRRSDQRTTANQRHRGFHGPCAGRRHRACGQASRYGHADTAASPIPACGPSWRSKRRRPSHRWWRVSGISPDSPSGSLGRTR